MNEKLPIWNQIGNKFSFHPYGVRCESQFVPYVQISLERCEFLRVPHYTAILFNWLVSVQRTIASYLKRTIIFGRTYPVGSPLRILSNIAI